MACGEYSSIAILRGQFVKYGILTILILMVALSVLFIFIGHDVTKNNPHAAAIIGNWRADARPTEWGNVRSDITFTKRGRFVYRNTFAEGGVHTQRGTYSVSDNALVMGEVNKGKPFPYSILGELLVMQVGGEAITFKRQEK